MVGRGGWEAQQGLFAVPQTGGALVLDNWVAKGQRWGWKAIPSLGDTLPRQDPEVPGGQKEIQGDAATLRREGRHRAVLGRAPGHAGPDQEPAGSVGAPAHSGGAGRGGLLGRRLCARSLGQSPSAGARTKPERPLGVAAEAGDSQGSGQTPRLS